MISELQKLRKELDKHMRESFGVSLKVYYCQRIKIIKKYNEESVLIQMCQDVISGIIEQNRPKDNTIQLRWNARKEKRMLNNLISSSPSPAQAPRRKRM